MLSWPITLTTQVRLGACNRRCSVLLIYKEPDNLYIDSVIMVTWLPHQKGKIFEYFVRRSVKDDTNSLEGSPHRPRLRLPGVQDGAGHPLRGRGGRPHLAALLGGHVPRQRRGDDAGPHGGLLPLLSDGEVCLPALLHCSHC